jgi:hypothetical protein
VTNSRASEGETFRDPEHSDGDSSSSEAVSRLGTAPLAGSSTDRGNGVRW